MNSKPCSFITYAAQSRVIKLWEKIVAKAMSSWVRKHTLRVTSPSLHVTFPACVCLSKCPESGQKRITKQRNIALGDSAHY